MGVLSCQFRPRNVDGVVNAFKRGSSGRQNTDGNRQKKQYHKVPGVDLPEQHIASKTANECYERDPTQEVKPESQLSKEKGGLTRLHRAPLRTRDRPRCI